MDDRRVEHLRTLDVIEQRRQIDVAGEIGEDVAGETEQLHRFEHRPEFGGDDVFGLFADRADRQSDVGDVIGRGVGDRERGGAEPDEFGRDLRMDDCGSEHLRTFDAVEQRREVEVAGESGAEDVAREAEQLHRLEEVGEFGFDDVFGLFADRPDGRTDGGRAIGGGEGDFQGCAEADQFFGDLGVDDRGGEHGAAMEGRILVAEEGGGADVAVEGLDVAREAEQLERFEHAGEFRRFDILSLKADRSDGEADRGHAVRADEGDRERRGGEVDQFLRDAGMQGGGIEDRGARGVFEERGHRDVAGEVLDVAGEAEFLEADEDRREFGFEDVFGFRLQRADGPADLGHAVLGDVWDVNDGFAEVEEFLRDAGLEDRRVEHVVAQQVVEQGVEVDRAVEVLDVAGDPEGAQGDEHRVDVGRLDVFGFEADGTDGDPDLVGRGRAGFGIIRYRQRGRVEVHERVGDHRVHDRGR